MDLCMQLRTAMDPIHTEVESLPLARAMASGTVSREEYIHLLQLLLAAHRGWEAAMDREPLLQGLWHDSMRRVPALERDLQALGGDGIEQDHPATNLWLAALKERAEVRPEVWIGVLYLFEGSRMGSMALLKPVSQALGVIPRPGQGVDYHLDGIADRVPQWQRLKAQLNALPLGMEQQQAAVWGAVSTFRMLRELYATPSQAAVMANPV